MIIPFKQLKNDFATIEQESLSELRKQNKTLDLNRVVAMWGDCQLSQFGATHLLNTVCPLLDR